MKRRSAIALIVVVALLVAALALRWAMRPQVLGPRVMAMAGQALGLEISAAQFDYRLIRGPQVVARGVSARVPGAELPMLDAERVLVTVPWSTLHALGAEPTLTRIELDAPRMRLEPFMHWWSQRTPGEGPPPTLREGLRVDRGSIEADTWSLQDLAIDLAHLAPDARVEAGVRGAWRTDAVQVPFDLQVAMTRPAADAGIGTAGTLTPRADEWRIPARVVASTRLGATGDGAQGFRLRGLRLSANARYISAETTQPFVLGLAGEGAFADGVLELAPAALALRGQDMIPRLRGRGRLGIGEQLEFDLAGDIERWPDTWPALPSPIGDSTAPLPFEVGYSGTPGLSDPVELRLARDEARFEGQLPVPQVVAWAGDLASGTPLPPLDGRLTAPRMDIGGATLHGVEITVEDGPADDGQEP